MTLRAIVRDGMIDTHGEIPDGTSVRVTPTRAPRPKAKPASKAKPKSKKAAKRKPLKSIRDHPFFGMWKNRPEWKGLTTLEIRDKLREKGMGGRASTRPSRGN